MYTIPLSFLILSLVSYRASATSTNNVQYPAGQQLPLIARVGQPYNWSISPNTFGSPNDADTITVSSDLPSWLSFTEHTFSGTPQETDEGTVDVTLSYGGSDDSFQLCVTHFPPPTLNIPISSQFNGSNPSMSSVFFIDTDQISAFQDSNPALRIPLHWSFSIGFDYASFVSQNDLFYYAQQADGSPLPDWVTFDSNTVTYDGVTRSPPLSEGDKVSLVFIASDQAGYSAVRAPFDLFIDSHAIASSGDFVVNVTSGQPFVFDLRQDDWFFDGVTIDNTTIHSSNLTSLSVDTSAASWLEFDSSNFTLSGTAPSKGSFSIPMTLDVFNQSLTLNASVALLPSYFTSATLPGLLAKPGSDFDFAIASVISNNSDLSGHDVSYSVNSSASYLTLTPGSGGSYNLIGQIPSNPGASYVDAALTAYDHTTHAVSHSSLRISFKNTNINATSAAMEAKRRRLIYGLGIGLGGALAIVLIAGSMAVIRKCCVVPDSAAGIGPHTMARGSTEKQRDLFEQDLEKDGYGWSEKAGLGLSEVPQPFRPSYAHMGLGHPGTLIPGSPMPKKTTKGAFFNNVKHAVRSFSSGSKRKRSPRTRKSAISRPFMMNAKVSGDSLKALRAAAGLDDVPTSQHAEPYPSVLNVLDNPIEDGASFGTGIITTPTSSTNHSDESGKGSIPRRRADFGPPPAQASGSGLRAPAPAHVRGKSMDTQVSYFDQDDEVDGAVIVTGSRTISMRSARSSSYSYLPTAAGRDSSYTGSGPAKPRLVQFTSERGVPVPVPTINGGGAPAGPREQRRSSLHAAVVSPAAGRHGMALDAESDAILNEGMRYVRAFGDPAQSTTGPTHSNSKRSSRSTANQTNTTSSYVYPSPSQSLKSGQSNVLSRSGSSKRTSKGSLAMSRILVRTGERFAFKYPVSLPPTSPAISTPSTSSTARPHADRKLIARPLNGGKGSKLPAFLLSSVTSALASPSASSPASESSKKKRKERYEVEFWGTPAAKDVGEIALGIYAISEGADGSEMEECVGRLVIEAVLQRR